MAATPRSASSFNHGGGEMGARVRALDWAATPLGPIESWSPTLRTSVDMMLSSGFAACLFWGPDFIAIYNDGYRVMLGDKPEALGEPMRVTWAEAWESLKPIAEKALAGETVFIENYLLKADRHGHIEDAYFTFSYSPIFDEHGEVVGMIDVVVETTGQVLGERQAMKERQRQRRLLDQMPGFVAVLEGPDHVFSYVNEAYIDISGPRQFVGRTVREVFPELDGQGFFELLDGVYTTGEPVRARAVPISLTGDTGGRFIDLLYEPIREESGAISGIFVGGYDVTAQKLVEADLLASEARLRELNADLERRIVERALARGKTWQLSPELLGVANSAGYFETSNPAWLSVLGWSEAEVSSTYLFDFIHPDDVARTLGVFEDAMQRSLPALRFENRYRTKAGAWRWLSWVAVPEDDKIYCSARDIQSEKEHEAALAERTVERDVLAKIVETTDVFIQVLDKDLRFLAINKANADEYERIYGKRPQVGDSLRELLGDRPDHLAAAEVLWQRALAGESFTLVEEFGDPALQRRCYEMKLEVLRGPDGVQTGAFMTGYDITERLREQAALSATQEALRQSQKMEAVGQLTGGLAHDFNNLLLGISGSLQLMHRQLPNPSAPDLDRYIGLALGGTKRAAALTHRLLAFSRQQTLAPKPLNMSRLAMSMEELIRRTIGPEITLEVVSAVGLWTVFADPGQLENALLNLCINARDAMPDGGKLVIETANRWIDERSARKQNLEPGRYVSMCVSDNGVGMAPDVVARAFDPFFTTKPLGLGTGLGLSMVYGFTRQSGGQARIYSEPGQGTMVCIYLPRTASPEVVADDGAAPAVLPRAQQAQKVLLVDDEPTVRLVVQELLEEIGFEVLPAADGFEGLKLLEGASDIALLITDVGLPGGMNGRQVAERARAIKPQLKVLFITGYAENAVLSHGHLDAGMQVMTKPFELDALARKVKDLTEAPLAG